MRFDLSGCGAGLESMSTDRILELAPWLEAVGFEGLWINEEHFRQGSGRVCLSPILLATALAARTRTIRIGFSVLVLPLYEPIRLAEEIATLDVLTGGRVDFGISRGNTSRYFDGWGLDYEARTAAFQDTLGKVIRYWTEPSVEVGRRVESIEPKCVQQPHPPVYVATYREDTCAWLGEQGHQLLQGAQQTVDSLRRCLRAFADAGGDVKGAPIGRFVYVAETDEQARRDAFPVVERLTEGYRRSGIQVGRRIATDDDLHPERFYHETAIIGSPETVAARIAELRDDLGVDIFMFLTAFLALLPEHCLRSSLELLASEVMPRFQPVAVA